MKVDAPPLTGTNHANIITISETLLAFYEIKWLWTLIIIQKTG